MTNGDGTNDGDGLTDGNGLTNGNGLTDGDGPVGGRDTFLSLPGTMGVRRRASGSLRRRRRQALFAVLVGTILMAVPAILYTAAPGEAPPDEFSIDGQFDDWADRTRGDDIGDAAATPNLNIRSYGAAVGDGRISAFVEVKGYAMGDPAVDGLAADTVCLLVDVDSDASTGYAVDGIGADLRLESQGAGMELAGTMLFRYDDARDPTGADWHAFEQASPGVSELNDNRLEMGASIPSTRSYEGNWRAVLITSDSDGNSDTGDTILCDGPAVRVSLGPTGWARAIPGGTGVPAATIDLGATDVPLSLEGITISTGGDAAEGAIGSAHLMLGERVIGRGAVTAGGAIVFSGLGEELPRSEGVSLDLLVDISPGAPETGAVRLCLADCDAVRFGSGTAQVLTGASSAVLGLGPGADGIVIDGLFDDWEGVEPMPWPSLSPRNPNVDIVETRMAADGTGVQFMLSVDGVVMEGAPMIMEPLRLPVEEERPAGRPAPHGGKEVEVPREPLYARDAAYAFVDMDGDPSTGFSRDLPLGAELMVKVEGRQGEVELSSSHVYDGGTGHWSPGEPASAVAEGGRIEASAAIPGGLPEGAEVFILMTDWRGETDGVSSLGRWWNMGAEDTEGEAGALDLDPGAGPDPKIPEFGLLAIPISLSFLLVLAGRRRRGGGVARTGRWFR